MGSPGTMDARERSNVLRSSLSQTPITSSNFLPTPIPPPRAWERIAVPSSTTTRQRKIWKRTEFQPTTPRDVKYIAAMTELESKGDIARKCSRSLRHVPPFGDAPWDLRLDGFHDGKRALEEARITVTAANKAAASGASDATPADRTRSSVPRKRHNSRWPIEPKKISAEQVAGKQPPVEPQVPPVAEPVEVPRQVDAVELMRRSMLPVIRRITLAPGDEFPRRLGTIASLLPTGKTQAPEPSPMKRAPITLSSPTKVAESPRRLFSVDVPSKGLLLETPKPDLPAHSPCKSSPVMSTSEPVSIAACLSDNKLSAHVDTAPLLFDQPIPPFGVEPQYETRRRISLQSARRSERRSSGVSKLLVDFDAARKTPNRRHSFALPEQVLAVDSKSRRNTLDIFCGRPDEVLAAVTEDDAEIDNEGSGAQEHPIEDTPVILPAYEVDAGTNLDIFGQAQQSNPTISPNQALASSLNAPLKASHNPPHASPTVSTSTPEASPDASAGPPEPCPGASAASPEASLETSAGVPDGLEADVGGRIDFGFSQPFSTPNATEMSEEALVCESEESEGLSIIYEEDSETPGMSPSHVVETGENVLKIDQNFLGIEEIAVGAESPRSDTSGFTPINGRQISPTSPADAPAEEIEDDMMDVDNEVTAAVEEEYTLSVAAPKPENDTLTLLALHDDAEFVRDFVSRVTAGKNAKAAAAAAEAAAPPSRKVGRLKRRSGSTGSTTTSAGSPVAKSDTPKRTPLGEKSLNSPSPLKKRKLEEAEEATSKPKDDVNNTSEDAEPDAPKIKRRRKRADPILEQDEVENSPSKPDGDGDTSGPRRSTRARSTRIALKSSGPSANSIARSTYSVRLGSNIAEMVDDSIMESTLTVSKYRSEATEMAAVTRSNTRANKAGAVFPRVLLARQAEDPAAWRMKELKGVFDAKESRAAAGNENTSPTDADGGKKDRKNVRWAEELVQYQADDSSANRVFKTMAKSLLADIMNADGSEDDEDELAMPVLSKGSSKKKSSRDAFKKAAREESSKEKTRQPAEESTTAAPAPAPARKQAAAPPRRTRSSRLQPPTPIKRLGTASKATPLPVAPPVVKTTKASSSTKAGAKKALPTPSKGTTTAKSTTKAAASSTSSKTSSSSSTKASSSSSTTRGDGMATRRTKIASLGMGVNGTPAPKKRGRPAAA